MRSRTGTAGESKQVVANLGVHHLTASPHPLLQAARPASHLLAKLRDDGGPLLPVRPQGPLLDDLSPHPRGRTFRVTSAAAQPHPRNRSCGVEARRPYLAGKGSSVGPSQREEDLGSKSWRGGGEGRGQ